jgi:SAM-dependent methyltransferase
LLRDGNLHLLPVYYILCLSELGREGIQNSGSFRFADHIYRDEPAGITPLGKWLDARLLALPATVAFRERYKQSQLAMRDALERFSDAPGPLRILAIPCGIPRDLKQMADTLERENPSLLERLTYVGMDLDPELLEVARRYLKDCSGRSKTLHRGNALVRAEYPEGKFHAIVSTGLGEFLTDEEICVFYRNVHEALTPGGTFYTSATAREGRSERLMRAFELYTQYRTADKLRILLGELPWKELSIKSDQSGLQSFVRATKA